MPVCEEYRMEVITEYAIENNELKMKIIELENKIHHLEQLVELLRVKSQYGRISNVPNTRN